MTDRVKRCNQTQAWNLGRSVAKQCCSGERRAVIEKPKAWSRRLCVGSMPEAARRSRRARENGDFGSIILRKLSSKWEVQLVNWLSIQSSR